MSAFVPTERYESTLAAIDAANAEDPNRIVFRGETHPKEAIHAERASDWLEVLAPEADELLRIAVRAHHLRRWVLPRTEYPAGRAGYHAWRRALQKQHAAETAEMMRAAGYSEDECGRVGELIRKQGLGRDAQVQIFEDVLCLVFVELQLESFAEAHDADQVVEILARTLPKMSARAIDAAAKIVSTPASQALLGRAVERVQAAVGDPTKNSNEDLV